MEKGKRQLYWVGLAWWLLASAASAAVSQVQAVSHTNSAWQYNVSVTLSSAPAEGDILIAIVDASRAITSVTDNVGNTWEQVENVYVTDGTPRGAIGLWYCKSPAAQVATVTATITYGNNHQITVLEYSGLAADPLDHSASSGSATYAVQSQWTTPDITTTGDNELLVGFVMLDGIVTDYGDWNLMNNSMIATQVVNSAGAYNYHVAYTSPHYGRNAGLIASFKVKSAEVDRGWPHRINGVASGSATTADLDGDGQREVIVEGGNGLLYIYRWDGAPFSIGGQAFPRSFGPADGSLATPAIGDVTGDGHPDIVLAGDDEVSNHSAVYIYDLQNSTTTTLTLNNPLASGKGSVALVDCRSHVGGVLDPALEMIFRDGNGTVYVLGRVNGAFGLIQTWTTAGPMDFDAHGSLPMTSTPSVVELNRTMSSSSHLILISSSDGRLYYGQVNSSSGSDWSASASLSSIVVGGRLLSSPAAAYRNGSGEVEVAVGTTSNTIALVEIAPDLSASIAHTIATQGWVVSSPAIGQLDNDSDLEYVVGCDDDMVYAFNPDGTLLPGWPMRTQGDVFASPVVADVDGEPGPEVISTSLDRGIYIWHRDTSGNWIPLDGWPKHLDGPIFASPAVADLNGNDRMSLVVPSYNGLVTCWDMAHISADPSGGWRQFHGNEALTGSR